MFTVSQFGLIRKSKEAVELITDASFKIPKSKTTNAIIYLNNMVNKIDEYETMLRQVLSQAKSICTYISDNLDGITRQ
ncbi:hypothetical protein D3C74_72540 [compost metagenome]